MSVQEHFVIVYQFGKVASTALVKSLNACAGIEAQQSHFLGDDALKRIVVNATHPNLSPYFRKHMVGQLLTNLDLTQKLKQIQNGNDARKLTVVSLAREPLDWFRSSLQQDIAGYQENLAALTDGLPDDPMAIRDGIVQTLAELGDVIEQCGGASQVVPQIVEHGGRAFLEKAGVHTEFQKTMLLLSLRPLVWFEDHFRKCFGFSLKDIPRQDGFWLKKGNPASFVVLRYEDIAQAFEPAMMAAGVPFSGDVVRANLSHTKRFSTEIREAFSHPSALEFGRLLRASEYGRRFGYGDLSHQNTQVEMIVSRSARAVVESG